MNRIFIRNTLFQFVILLLLWLVLSGHYDLFHVSLGVLSSAGITLMHLKIRRYHYEADPVFKGRGMGRAMSIPRFVLVYIPWLIWQVIKASLQVASVVLKPNMPIDPALITFKTRLPSIGAKVLLGNSITLTPGTITLDIDDGDNFTVHSLMDLSSGGIIDDSLPAKVARLYEKNPARVSYDINVVRG